METIQTNRLGFGPLFCLLGLQALGLAPFHRPIMQVLLFVIVAARGRQKKNRIF
jgi:hypothetical protein